MFSPNASFWSREYVTIFKKLPDQQDFARPLRCHSPIVTNENVIKCFLGCFCAIFNELAIPTFQDSELELALAIVF